MAGQEGFEPPTPGFGVRRSTVRATGLTLDSSKPNSNTCYLLLNTLGFSLFMLNMLTAMPAIFTEHKFSGHIFFVLCS